MKKDIYNQSKYYEIAFSFVDAKKQVALFEKFIKKFSKIPVNKVLDIACGPALQLFEFAKQGYEAIGLDANAYMLDYIQTKAGAQGSVIKTAQADMNDFDLKQKVDFAYILMGSIVYTKNNQLFLTHLDSVASSLKSGGLYLIENLDINWGAPEFFKTQSWVMSEGKIKVKTTFKLSLKNALQQLVTQFIKLEVTDNGKKAEFVEQDDFKIIFPEEFKLLVEKNNQFEFMGFFERDKVQALKDADSNNIVILRRK